MTQPFMEFLHSADANTIPEDMLSLRRKWLLDLLGVAASMSVVESDTYNAAFPANRISCVTLTLKNGATLTSGDTEALGDPENPVNDAEVKAKFMPMHDQN